MKIFKVLFAASAALLLAVGCQKYDDSALTQRISGLEQKVSSVESQISALQNAIDQKITVSKVETTDAGWKITFSDNKVIDLTNGKFTSVTVDGSIVNVTLNDEAKTTFVLSMAKNIAIDPDEDFIEVQYGVKTNVPYYLPEGVEFATVAATVLYADGSATDIKTKAASSDWTVEIISDNSIQIGVDDYADFKDAILQVSAIAKDGTSYTASKLIKITAVCYGNYGYGIARMENGKVWMTENLHYVPEGCTLGVPGDTGVNIFYPYSTDGTNTSALKDDASVQKLGYLYSGDVLFGTALTKDNVHSYEGKQGICPPGWHIPTRAEYLALCGSSNKDDSGTETGTVIDDKALFYDADYKAGKVKKFNDGGWNFAFSGCVVNGAYNKTMIAADKCAYSEWVGSCAMNYYWTSTGYVSPTATSPKPQLFALMTTFTSTNNEGKVSLAYCNTSYAAPLRCVKNN